MTIKNVKMLVITLFIIVPSSVFATCPPCSATAAQFCNGCFTNNLGVQGNFSVCGTSTFYGPVHFSFTGSSGTGCTGGAFNFPGDVGITDNLNVCGFINTESDFRLAGLTILNEDTIGDGNLSIGFNTNNVNNGEDNTAVGFRALSANATGIDNTALGVNALAGNTSGENNIGIGSGALYANTSGTDNIGIGFGALATNTTAGKNIAIGTEALVNSNALGNVAIGYQALTSNTLGLDNIGIGALALFSNTLGSENISIGVLSSFENVSGDYNIAIGSGAFSSNISGSRNLCCGVQSLKTNGGGDDNIGLGYQALFSNLIGNSNIAIGSLSLFLSSIGNANTTVGTGSLINLAFGDNNIALGINAGSNLINSSDAIMIGSQGLATDTNIIRIGAGQSAAYLAGVYGVPTAIADAIPVVVDSAGQFGTTSSSQRFKENIETIADPTELLMQLRPVLFTYKHDKNHKQQFGLIAEEVAKVYPDLVIYDKEGQIYTVNYMALIPLLLAKIQNLERKSQDYERELGNLKIMLQDYAA